MVYFILAIAFAVIAVASFVGAWLKRSKRVAFAMAVISAGIAAGSARLGAVRLFGG